MHLKSKRVSRRESASVILLLTVPVSADETRVGMITRLKIKTVTCELTDTNAITGVGSNYITSLAVDLSLSRLQNKCTSEMGLRRRQLGLSITSAGAIAIFMATDKPGKPVMVCTVHIG